MIKKFRDGTEIELIKRQKVDEPKANVLIIHGMAEHIKRYEDFFDFLSNHGYGVYGYDQRGHGKTAGSIENLGYFDLGWKGVVDDVKEVVASLPRTVPLVLMGHSMGSFVVRDYVRKHSETIDGLIISGTGASSGISGQMATLIARYYALIKGDKSQNKVVADLMEKGCLKGLNPARTPFDWLSRDEKEVDKYIKDPYCGTVFSNQFYRELFPAIERVNKLKNYQGMDLPTYIFSGDQDPVGDYGKGVRQVYNLFEKITQPVEMKLYKNGRHEMLNEVNKDQVYQDVLKWLDKRYYAKN